MSDSIALTPYIEPEDPQNPASDRFVAGFKDKQGNRVGTEVPVDRAVIARLMLTSTPFEPRMDEDGAVQAVPDDFAVEDEVYGEMIRGELLPKVPVDHLVAEIIGLSKNEPNEGEDGVLRDFGIMRERLARALKLAEAEIARRLQDGR